MTKSKSSDRSFLLQAPQEVNTVALTVWIQTLNMETGGVWPIRCLEVVTNGTYTTSQRPE